MLSTRCLLGRTSRLNNRCRLAALPTANIFMPGLVELHRHLDVSVRLSTLWDLSKGHGIIGNNVPYDQFVQNFVIPGPQVDLATVLEHMYHVPRVFSTYAILERVAYENVEDCWQEGIRKVELRFSPTFVNHYHEHITWQQCLEAFHQGVQRACQQYAGMEVGLICIASRNYGPEQVAATVDFFMANRDRLVGLDLAGAEVGFPNHLFEEAFLPAKKVGANITIHAGEALGPENIWSAIQLLGAKRIGHACTAGEDPALLRYMAQNKICIEACPSSNWITRAVPSLGQHPLRSWLDQGIPVTINTDDPIIFGVDLPKELRICREVLGLSSEEVAACTSHAHNCSFLSRA